MLDNRAELEPRRSRRPEPIIGAVLLWIALISAIAGLARADAANWGRIHFKEFLGIDEPVPFPDPDLTPGELSSARTVDQICSPDFRTGSVRCVKAAMKADVALLYGIDPHGSAWDFEGDHYFALVDKGTDPCEVKVPPALLNSHDPVDKLKVGKMLAANFWYEPARTRPYVYVLPDGREGHFGAAAKDKIEVLVRKALCKHEFEADRIPTLFANWPLIYVDWTAQREAKKKSIALDWAHYSSADLGEYVEYKDGKWQKLLP
jgi:hypothetical protein